MTQRKRVTARVATVLIKALIAGSHTYAELMAITGLQQPTVSAWIKELRHAQLVRIVSWDLDPRGYPTIARFGWGFGDCVKPVLSNAERMRRSRAKAV